MGFQRFNVSPARMKRLKRVPRHALACRHCESHGAEQDVHVNKCSFGEESYHEPDDGHVSRVVTLGAKCQRCGRDCTLIDHDKPGAVYSRQAEQHEQNSMTLNADELDAAGDVASERSDGSDGGGGVTVRRKPSGWIGVDLDGTLAHYDHWRGPEHIGEPVPAMLARVKRWLADGLEVRIFTARAYCPPGDQARLEETKLVHHAICEWCRKHLGQTLPITCTKDFAMIELWDDRAVQVLPNTGIRVDGVGRKYDAEINALAIDPAEARS